MRHCRKIARDDRASIKYGINRKSVLTQLKYFDICNGGLIPDLMHDMLEGLLPYETKLVLKHNCGVKICKPKTNQPHH